MKKDLNNIPVRLYTMEVAIQARVELLLCPTELHNYGTTVEPSVIAIGRPNGVSFSFSLESIIIIGFYCYVSITIINMVKWIVCTLNLRNSSKGFTKTMEIYIYGKRLLISWCTHWWPDMIGGAGIYLCSLGCRRVCRCTAGATSLALLLIRTWRRCHM